MKGFSLIEVLISGVLLSLVGIMLMTTLNSSITVKDRVDVISNRFHLIRQAMARMTRELSMAYISGHKNPNNPIVETRFKGKSSSVSFVAFGGLARMQGAKESDQREISYFIEEDKKTGKPALMRKEKINPGKNQGDEGNVQVMCPNISKLELKYWNDRSQKWDTEWQTEGVASEQYLPSRVQLEIVAKLEDDEEEKFVTETLIWVTKPILIK